MLNRVVALLLCGFALPVTSFGWGREGHRVVAKIAAKNLSQDARNKVATILGTNNAGVEEALAEASTWPDEINKSQTKTADWHFVDVPVTAPFAIGEKSYCSITFVSPSACPKGVSARGSYRNADARSRSIFDHLFHSGLSVDQLIFSRLENFILSKEID